MRKMTEMGRGMSGWRWIALTASLVLNLFLSALIAGHLWHVRSGDGEVNSRMPLARALARAEASLPPKDAAAFGAVLRRDEQRYAESALRLREARQNVRRQIAADPYDQAAVQQALTAWQEAWNRFMGDFSHSLVEALSKVSPEGRRKLLSERRSGGFGSPAP